MSAPGPSGQGGELTEAQQQHQQALQEYNAHQKELSEEKKPPDGSGVLAAARPATGLGVHLPPLGGGGGVGGGGVNVSSSLYSQKTGGMPGLGSSVLLNLSASTWSRDRGERQGL